MIKVQVPLHYKVWCLLKRYLVPKEWSFYTAVVMCYTKCDKYLPNTAYSTCVPFNFGVVFYNFMFMSICHFSCRTLFKFHFWLVSRTLSPLQPPPPHSVGVSRRCTWVAFGGSTLFSCLEGLPPTQVTCFHILWPTFCPPPQSPQVNKLSEVKLKSKKIIF